MSHLARTALALATLAAAAPAQLASLQAVTAGPVTSTSGESLGLAWGDVDGDGDPDLLVVQGNGSRPNLLYRNEGGAFVAVPGDPLATTAGNSSSATFADLDGDGDLDAFVTNRLGQHNQLFRNLGGAQGGVQGTFEHVVAGSLVMDGGDSSAAVAVDLDGDGDLDLAVANRAGEGNLLYVNQGRAQGGTTGVFARQLTGVFATDGGDSRDVLAGDLDGDGAPDLLVVNAGGEDFLYLGDGAGGFTRLLQGGAATASGDGQAGALGDLDNDGDLDLVVGHFLQPNAVFLNQDGAQGGVPGVLEPVNGGYASLGATPTLDLALADWDLDGVLDLAVANCCGAGNELLVGAGNGFFQLVPESPVASAAGSSTALGFADYDRDGAPDLLVVNRESAGGSTDLLFRNHAPGTFLARAAPAELQQPFALAAGDVDGDGDVDLFVPNKAGLPSRLYRNQGGAQGGLPGELLLDAGSLLTADAGDAFGATFGDLDGDGDLDLAVAHRNGEDNALYVNQGGAQGGTEGEFAPLAGDAFVTSGGSSRDVRAADVEGDGDLDLFVANSGGESDFLFLNQGGVQGGQPGSFVLDAGSPVVTDGGKAYGADFGDVDGDGDPDLFVASRQGEADRLYLNQGGLQGGPAGTFVLAGGSAVAAAGGDGFAGTFGDPDNDGDLDLFVANAGPNAFFVNQGGAQGGTEGVLLPLHGVAAVARSDSSRRGTFADIDGDGDHDLFVPNVGAPGELFRSQGGVLSPMATALPAAQSGDARAALFTDLDGDGAPELLVARFDAPLAVFGNTSPPPLAPWSTVGDPLPGTHGAPALWGTGSLRPNTPVTLATKDGPPIAPAWLIAGGVALHAPLLGATLVPSPDVVLATGTNPGGHLALTGFWPHAVPRGAVVYFQVFVSDPGAPFGFAATAGLRAISQ